MLLLLLLLLLGLLPLYLRCSLKRRSVHELGLHYGVLRLLQRAATERLHFEERGLDEARDLKAQMRVKYLFVGFAPQDTRKRSERIFIIQINTSQ
jgi:hypothetical protein